MTEERLRVLVLLGTRPEAIKLAPVVRALDSRPSRISTRVCSTGQHREMIQQVVDAVGLRIDVQLDAMAGGMSLGALTSRLFGDLDRLLESENPEWVIVQGDTTTAMAGAMSAFYRRIGVGHVEAGLRTHNRWSPFPEEINRTVIASVADLHFAPTPRAAENLHLAGIADEAIYLTGNTVVDSLLWVREQLGATVPNEMQPEVAEFIEGHRLILATSHRRESFGSGLEGICRALLDAVALYEDAVVVFPVHPNPEVKVPVHRLLGRHPRIKLVGPLEYRSLVWLMSRCYCIVTDSGGIQEEAPSLGKPLLIARDTTERGEVIEAGCARLVGTRIGAIVSGIRDLFDNSILYADMSRVRSPFGDGQAAERIARVLEAQRFAGRLAMKPPEASE